MNRQDAKRQDQAQGFCFSIFSVISVLSVLSVADLVLYG
jgi:hypothetical protein